MFALHRSRRVCVVAGLKAVDAAPPSLAAPPSATKQLSGNGHFPGRGPLRPKTEAFPVLSDLCVRLSNCSRDPPGCRGYSGPWGCP